MKEAAAAHNRAAQRLLDFVVKPDDKDFASRAAAALKALPGDAAAIAGQAAIAADPQKVTVETIEKILSRTPSRATLIEMLRLHTQECERISQDINDWLNEHPAKGGSHLADREIAKLVALYFDHALQAAKAASLPIDDFPNVAFASDDRHAPRNPYCKAVEEALFVLQQKRTGWRSAAEYVCRNRK